MSVLTFFREQNLISFLMVTSIALIALGLVFILHNQKKAEQLQQEQQQMAAMQAIATMAVQELQKTASDTASYPIQDIKPAESAAKVATFNGQVPEVGSENWCEWMMIKDSSVWTPDEQALFAKHCI